MLVGWMIINLKIGVIFLNSANGKKNNIFYSPIKQILFEL